MNTPHFKNKFILIFLYIAIASILVFLIYNHYIYGNKKVNNSIESNKLNIGISRSFLSIPVYIAKRLRYFNKEGINVNIVEYSSGKLAMESMLSGKNDLSTAADFPIVYNSFFRKDFCIISTFTYSYKMVKVITRKDTGIVDARGLIGKKVEINPGTSSHFYLAAFLIYNRIPISELNLINIKTVDMPDALNNQYVDAISVWEPYAQKAINLLNGNAVVIKSPDIYRTTFNFVAKKSFVLSHFDLLTSFLKAIDMSTYYIQSNREKSIDIISAIFNISHNSVKS